MKIKCIHICSWLIVLLLFGPNAAKGQLPLVLPDILSDHAVLQRNDTVKLWGRGPGSFNLQIIASWRTADTITIEIPASGTWITDLRTPAKGGPYTISFICAKDTQVISDILIGDIWLCSGQSNMEFSGAWGIDKTDTACRFESNNEIRFFEVEKNYGDLPVGDCKGRWVKCTPESAIAFSTVGYFFGKQINAVERLPVGLIGAYWGGTNIQTWMPTEIFRDSIAKESVAYIEPYGWAPKGVASLYNAMIFPLRNYRLRGCIWYQGEANVDWDWTRYSSLLSDMVASWRRLFSRSLPFYAVEIAPWTGYKGLRAAALREQIQKGSSLIPQFGSVGISDLVPDTTDIHPIMKRSVGERLAAMALKEVYGHEELNPYAPAIASVIFRMNSATVAYSSAGPLISKSKTVNGFQLAGEDGIFHPAKAMLQKGNKINVVAAAVSKPVALRYCFENAAIPGLFGQTGLPLKQFRSDNYPIN